MSVNSASNDVVGVYPSALERNKYVVANPSLYQIQPPMPVSQSYSRVMPIPDLSTSSSVAMEGGKMSSVRRTFCLFVTFDVGLMFILWALYTQLFGLGWEKFKDQVERYDFRYSLFDTVMLSTVRFTLLILAYALFRIRHWWMIAITTLMSSVFLLTKVFMFDFGHESSAKNPLSYCLLIISFVLAWLETWFLDFKVLPHEKKERQRLAGLVPNYGSVAGGPGYHDRQRLLQPDDAMSSATFDQYYSPIGTPEGSDTEDGETRGAVGGGTALSQNQLDEYHRLAKECWDTMWDYLTSPESDWKHQTGDSVEDGIIHSKHVKGYGKIFRLQAKVHLDAKRLWEEMVHNINHAPQWNPTLLECNTVLVINNTTDISHNVANEAVGGIISSRDFVNLRHWGVREGIYISAGVGVTHPDCPPSKKHIRGYNGPGGWAFKPVPGEPNTCIFIWIMNTDIKGWVPQRIVDQASAGVLLDYLSALREHVKDFERPSV